MDKTENELVLAGKNFIPASANKIEAAKLQLSAIKEIKNVDQQRSAEEVIKASKQLIKAIEGERKVFTTMLDRVKADAMSYEKDLIVAITNPEKLSTEFLRAESERVRLENERIEKDAAEKAAIIQLKADQKQAVIDFELHGKNSINQAEFLKDVDNIKKRLENFEPTETKYGDNLKETIRIKKELIKLCDQKRQALKGKEDFIIDTKQVEQKSETLATETLQQVQNVDLTAQAKSQSVGSVAGIKKIWKFKVIDITKVPKEFIIIDEVKVNAMIKAGTRSMDGIQIYEEIGRSGR